MSSILIVRLGALGDVIHALPVVAALRRAWPAAQIDWVVDPRYASIVRATEGVDRTIAFDGRGLLKRDRRRQVVAAVREMRRRRYDVVLDLQGLLKSAVVARLSGGRDVVGFARAHLREPAARFLYSRTVDVPSSGHVVEKNLALADAIGAHVRGHGPLLRLPDDGPVADVVARHGATGYVVMNPGAGWPNKQWGAERFGRAAAALHASSGVRTVVTWGPREEDDAHAAVVASNGCAEMAPPTSVLELFALLGRARLVVAGDTGPLHMAAFLGTPVVALFGPTSPERNGPWPAGRLVLSRAGACECHYERRCHRAVPCLEDLPVDEVVRACLEMLPVGREARS